MNIVVVGTGYAGLVAGAVFADLGDDVVCVDRVDDPVATDDARPLLPPAVSSCESPHDAADGADAVALVTGWNAFKFLDLDRLRGRRRPVTFDGRNPWEPERMRRPGFEYHPVGRRPVLLS